MVKTQHFQHRGCGFDSSLGTKIPNAARCGQIKNGAAFFFFF